MFYTFASCCLCCCLIGVFGDIREKSVMEGDSVTLNTDLTKIETDEEISWMFGVNGPLIADKNGVIAEIHLVSDGRFRDRLKLNTQTGSLTIMNITSDHAGVYDVEISGSTSVNRHRFSVTVHVNTINSSPSPSPTTECSKSEHLNITELCQKHAELVSGWGSAEAGLRLFVTALMGVAAAAAVVLLVNDIRLTRASMTKTGDLS